MADYEVKQGDCLTSIAKSFGVYWEHLWKLSENAELRKKRNNPNILFPGDIVVVPETQLRLEDRSGEPAKLKIRFLAAGKPLANEAYTLKIAEQTLQGITDSSGLLQQPIPHDATEATLVLDREKLEFPLAIGHLDPIDQVSGVQARLNNLGYHCAAVDGIMGPLTRSALLTFQESYVLKQTGEPDSATCDKLRSLHGC